MKHLTIAFTVLLTACGSTPGSTTNDGGNPSSDGGNPSNDGGTPSSDAGGPSSDGGSSGDGAASSDGGGGGDSATSANATIFTIVLENHDYNEIVGSSHAPYINGLIASYGLATNYKDTGHPSLPNYLHMISGDNQYPGIVDVGPKQVPWFPSAADNVGNQMTAAGIPWRSYQESMGTACKLSDSGDYATKHDPFLYFKDIQSGPNGLCASTNVDYQSFATDLTSNAYRYMWITPNLLDDGHNPTNDPVTGLEQSDTWCSTEIPKILASPGFQAGGVLFLTWDEAEGRNGDSVDLIPMIIVSPRIKTAGMTSSKAYTHSSYLATVEDLLGLPRLATVTNEPNMLEFLK
jgi:hypothetical protein